MGIDWEEILDAEGDELADAYADNIPEDAGGPAYRTDWRDAVPYWARQLQRAAALDPAWDPAKEILSGALDLGPLPDSALNHLEWELQTQQQAALVQALPEDERQAPPEQLAQTLARRLADGTLTRPDTPALDQALQRVKAEKCKRICDAIDDDMPIE